MSIKLNLGAGATELPGYINVDRKTGGEVFPLSVDHWDESRAMTGRIPDQSVDEIYASHVLEHFGHRQTLDVVKEWVRVLKPGGVLKVAVPNFDAIIHYYQTGTDERAEAYLMGGHVDADDRHGAIFNERKLRELFKLAGLTGVKRWKSEIKDCASLPVSLNLMGVKRELPKELPGVTAVLSMPRLGFTDTSACLLESCLKLKLPTLIRQGVFWGATLSNAIEMALKGGARYVLTVDYDTVFHPDDVRELYRLAEETPDAAAICGMQMGRDRVALLMTKRGADGKNQGEVHRDEIEADLMPIATGHFGLTLIRADVFAKLPKPWFLGKPATDGTWGEGRTDEDIYFWRQVEAAGLKLYQANGVKLGHLQMVVTWPDHNLQPLHQLVTEYRQEGVPAEVGK